MRVILSIINCFLFVLLFCLVGCKETNEPKNPEEYVENQGEISNKLTLAGIWEYGDGDYISPLLSQSSGMIYNQILDIKDNGNLSVTNIWCNSDQKPVEDISYGNWSVKGMALTISDWNNSENKKEITIISCSKDVLEFRMNSSYYKYYKKEKLRSLYIDYLIGYWENGFMDSRRRRWSFNKGVAVESSLYRNNKFFGSTTYKYNINGDTIVMDRENSSKKIEYRKIGFLNKKYMLLKDVILIRDERY